MGELTFAKRLHKRFLRDKSLADSGRDGGAGAATGPALLHLGPPRRQQGTLAISTVTYVDRASTFALRRSTLDFCLGGQRCFT